MLRRCVTTTNAFTAHHTRAVLLFRRSITTTTTTTRQQQQQQHHATVTTVALNSVIQQEQQHGLYNHHPNVRCVLGQSSNLYATTAMRQQRLMSSSSRSSTRLDVKHPPPDFSVDQDDDYYNDNNDNNDDNDDNSSPRRGGRRGASSSASSWMDRNAAFSGGQEQQQQPDVGSFSYNNDQQRVLRRDQRFAGARDTNFDRRGGDRRMGGGDRDRQRGGSGYGDRRPQQQQSRGPRPDGNRRHFENDRNWDKDRDNKTFREDFRGTRVFVKGLPEDASWQELKDHFRLAGEVVFASVSTDPATGMSKGHGVVQFETTEMARTAIDIMRDHPLNGAVLYVRQDVQETKDGSTKMLLSNNNKEFLKKGPTPPTKWKCGNDENAQILSDEQVKNVRALIKARDDARRRRQYEASDSMRDELKAEYGVYLDDRLKLWWTSLEGHDGATTTPVPYTVQQIKGEGRWVENMKPWRQIPTLPEQDACVDPDLVEGLLKQRDIARREKDFDTADSLLEQARTAPSDSLTLRIHDETRTWRIWTDAPPPRTFFQALNKENNAGSDHRNVGSPRVTVDPAQQCIDVVTQYAPEKIDEIKSLLQKFPGREYNMLKKLKQRYLQQQAPPPQAEQQVQEEEEVEQEE